MARKNKINTRLEIIQMSAHLFLQEGYTNVTIAKIAEKVGISKGNFTFYFPTKEYVLAELIKQLCCFQWMLMKQETATGESLLLAYLLEITAMAGSSHENQVARDLYVSAYVSPMSLRIIRENDTQKAMRVFAEFCPDWEKMDFVVAENIASGIEYSIFTAEEEQDVLLNKKISQSLNTIMKLYNIPRAVREENIRKVLESDYRKMGRRMLDEFCRYVEEENKRALEVIAEGR